MDSHEVNSEKTTGHFVKINLDNTQEVVDFAAEVMCRLAFFGTPDGMLSKDRAKAAYTNLDNLFNEVKQLLKNRLPHYEKENDNVRSQVPGSDPQADTAEQVGREEPSDDQV